jgi:WD40 repeat protein
MVTRDGRRLVTSVEGDGTVIRDARTMRALKTLPVGGGQAALSPDDRTMVVGRRDGSVRFVDLVTGQTRTGSGRHDGEVLSVAVSAAGTAVTAGEDNRAIVWDVERAAPVETLEGHAGLITGLAISRDGATLYTAGLDGKVIIWDLAGARRLGGPFDVGPRDASDATGRQTMSSVLSSDGRQLAVGHADGTVTVVEVRTLRTISQFRAVPEGPVGGLGFVPGAPVLAVGGGKGFLALVDPRTGTILRRLRGHRDEVFDPAFSADGRLMATLSGGGENSVLLWRLRSGRVQGPPRRYYATMFAASVSLSPDGRTMALAGELGIGIIDVATLRHPEWLPGSDGLLRLAQFTPDGRHIVGGSVEGWTRLWSTETGQPVTRRLGGHIGGVFAQSTSPDGRTLATGGTDGTIRLFDLRTQRPLGVPLPGLPNRPVAPKFTPDGAYLLAITNAGRAYRWDVRPASWARQACAVAGRTLTRAEWQDALPDREYAPAC